MSEIWFADAVPAASRVHVSAAAYQPAAFTSWTSRLLRDPLMPDAREAIVDPAAIEADAFAAGFDEGRRTVELELLVDRQAVARLAGSLEVLKPECPRALATLLSETVERLVRQIVGQVTIDGALLAQRAETCAALIADETAPGRMRLHPDDMPLLADAEMNVELVPDAAVTPGSVLLETADGWIEDGTESGLEKLRMALDRMGVPR